MSTPRSDVVRSRFFELTNEEWAVLGLGAATLVALVNWLRPDVTVADAYPPRLLMFHNAIPATEYLPYAVASTLALWIGLQLPPSRYLDKSWWYPSLEAMSPRVRHVLDGVIVAGLIAGWYSSMVPASLAFLAYLVSSFRFFAAMGWMVTETPGWRLRIAIVFGLLVVESTAGGMFYLIVHWGGYFALVYAFKSSRPTESRLTPRR